MNRNVMTLAVACVAFGVLTACPAAKECDTAAQCPNAGSMCVNNKCVAGTGGAGGATGGNGGAGGGVATGGGVGTGGMGGGVAVMPPTNETCAMATLITDAGTRNGSTVNGVDDMPGCDAILDSPGDSLAEPGPDVVYKVTVPAGQVFTATVTGKMYGGFQYDPGVYIIEAPVSNCDGTPDAGVVCTTLSDSSDVSAVETVSYNNKSTVSKDIFVVVDSFWDAPSAMDGANHEGPFTISMTFVTPGPGNECMTAEALTVGTATNGTTKSANGYLNDYEGEGAACSFWVTDSAAGGNGGPTRGNDRVYRLTVPAGQRATVTVTPTASPTFNPAIDIVEGTVGACASPVACLVGANSAGAGQPERVTVNNTSAMDKTVFAIVDSTGSQGDFSISYTLDMPAVGDTCSTAQDLDAGVLMAQGFAGFGQDYGAGDGCAPILGGERVYKLVLPAGSALRSRAVPNDLMGGFDVAMNLIEGASPTVCDVNRTCATSGDSFGSNRAEDLFMANETTSAKNYFLALGSWGRDAGTNTVDLTTEITPLTTGEVCTKPNDLGADAGVFSAQTTGRNNWYLFANATCAPYIGSELVYTFTVPAGKNAGRERRRRCWRC